MATITKREVHPHSGSIWQRIVALWEGYIGDATVTWAQATGDDSSHKAVTITLTGAVDTNVWILIDGGLRSAYRYRTVDLATKAGWSTMPKVQPATQAGRTTATNFNTQLVALRRSMWTYLTDCAVGTSTQATATPNNFPDSIEMFYWTVRFDALFFLDQAVLSLMTETASLYLFGSQQICDGATDPSWNTVGSSGGGSVDLGPLTTAVENIAMKAYDFTTNHGRETFSVNGLVAAEP